MSAYLAATIAMMIGAGAAICVRRFVLTLVTCNEIVAFEQWIEALGVTARWADCAARAAGGMKMLANAFADLGRLVGIAIGAAIRESRQ